MTQQRRDDVSWRRAATTGLMPLPLLPIWWIKRQKERPTLYVMRAAWLAFTASVALVFAVLLVVQRGMTRKPFPIFGYLLFGISIAGAVGMRWIAAQTRRRIPASVAQPAAIRASFFLRAAGAMTVVEMGFVLVFLSGQLWPYLVGAAIALPFLVDMMPSDRWVARQQSMANDAGLAVNVAELLEQPVLASGPRGGRRFPG